MTETRPYDSAEFLDTDEAVAEYLAAAVEEGDAALFSHALGVVARTRGMTQIAREAGLSRESLYRALSPEGNPSLDTAMRVMKALNVRLTTAPAGSGQAVSG
ncbi:putative addiction module antidote protein [Methylobacterium sp. NEAU 140]|uniref:addiction module antidote protein n=1 Tax=Methylobacterium sp. NEAU 140 TaxID=3064945 RepID=UPI0027354520|nr:addiction module antidote protein [Methylobacterium sp. NEAU 140]MDP4026127.1 putative addiction module antidote protein [Methylobacterium sp. NEAU 140]